MQVTQGPLVRSFCLGTIFPRQQWQVTWESEAASAQEDLVPSNARGVHRCSAGVHRWLPAPHQLWPEPARADGKSIGQGHSQDTVGTRQPCFARMQGREFSCASRSLALGTGKQAPVLFVCCCRRNLQQYLDSSSLAVVLVYSACAPPGATRLGTTFRHY